MAHIVPRRIYLAVFTMLIVLTAITVAAAQYNLGKWNIVLALAIAATKATLVVLFFMHVRYATRLTRLFVIGGFMWLAILLSLTLSDYATRAPLGFPVGW